mgnify:CR=1 FL=1
MHKNSNIHQCHSQQVKFDLRDWVCIFIIQYTQIQWNFELKFDWMHDHIIWFLNLVHKHQVYEHHLEWFQKNESFKFLQFNILTLKIMIPCWYLCNKLLKTQVKQCWFCSEKKHACLGLHSYMKRIGLSMEYSQDRLKAT